MSVKELVEDFKQLPPTTQMALVVFALVVVVLFIFYPTAGTNIITFLMALKMFATQR